MKKIIIKMKKIAIQDVSKPRFTGWIGGYGIHKTLKHPDRAKRKENFRREIREWQ